MDVKTAQVYIAECLDNLALIINTADPKDMYDYLALLEKVRHDADHCYAIVKEINLGN